MATKSFSFILVLMISLVIILILILGYSVLLIALFFFLTSEFFGAPFVPTSKNYLPEIVKKLKLKKGQVVYDLGSGNGRILRFISQRYPVKAVGIEINPLLVWGAILMSRMEGLKDISFKRKNLFTQDLSDADVVFVFLLSKTLSKLREKILKECRKGTIIVSHGFKFQGLENYLVDQIDRKVFCTYYYRLK